MDNVVIVGAGQAAVSCAARLRQKGWEGVIQIYGSEDSLPYERPPLSKDYLLGKMQKEQLLFHSLDWYKERKIGIRTGCSVTDIDPDNRFITTADREKVQYGTLIIATGANPRTLSPAQGGNLQGQHTIRTIRCIDAIEPMMSKQHRLLIVGGGFIGLEIAATARTKGMEVVIIEAGPRILGRVASQETADYIRALHKSHGVDVHEGVGLDRLIEEDGHAMGAILADGRQFRADLIVVSIGVERLTPLATLAGCEQNSGMLVDARGRTSVDNIRAIGDAAAVPFRGDYLRLENVQNAIDGAEAVADDLCGVGQDYEPEPWFWSDQFEMKLQIAGVGSGHDRVVVRDGGDARSHWHYRGNDLISVDAMNASRDYIVGKRLIALGRSPDPELVTDVSRPVKALLKA